MVSRVGTGDAALTALLSRQGAALRADLTRRTTELSTGQHADLGRAVQGDFSALAAIDQSLARIRGYAANTSEADLFTQTVQTALGIVSDGAAEVAASVLRGAGPANAAGLAAAATDAGRIFGTAVAALNTRFSERAVFSGVNAETQPLPDPDTLLSALEGAIAGAGAVTVPDIQAAIDGWFADPLGFDAQYAGGAGREGVPVAPGEEADISVTALDPAIKATLKDMATVALLGRGLLTGQHDNRAALARAAGEGLLSSGEARSHLMARVGTVQAQVAAAQARNGAEESALSIARAAIVTADPYEAATRLEELRTQLESLYLVTARVSRLSLADYI